ncbi:MAG: hypothetical protein OIN66_16995 [Candidatus Methanoperedens sp.]|nr:hypothetical protein [Candidatus Methanoperedens sp.]
MGRTIQAKPAAADVPGTGAEGAYTCPMMQVYFPNLFPTINS